MHRPRLAVLCDLLEENWPSMDLVADELIRSLELDFTADVEVLSVRPHFARRASRLPGLGRRRTAHNADILLSRFWDYPRRLRREHATLFHVSDHSYAHLVHGLPAQRTGVYCHDLHAFRCLLEPELEHRPFWYRSIMQRVLSGMQRAGIVFYSTSHVRRGIERAGLVESTRLVHAPYGTAPEYVAEPQPLDEAAAAALGLRARAYVMHVGSCIPRKRIDVLLDVFAEGRKSVPDLKLLQVGGSWTPEQTRLLRRRGLETDTIQVRGIERTTLAALYRGAAVVLQPSDAEGFGLPVIEALACGAPVVASDIAALREAGGDAIVYAAVGDVEAFTSALLAAVEGSSLVPDRTKRLTQAGRFSWTNHARIVLESYAKLVKHGSLSPGGGS